MWTYTQSDELYHHGIPGMKWGKRKALSTVAGVAGVAGVAAKGHQTIANIQRKSAEASKRDSESIRSQKDKMLALTKNGKPLFTKTDISNMIKAYDSQSKKMSDKAAIHEKIAKQLLSEMGQLKVRDL